MKKGDLTAFEKAQRRNRLIIFITLGFALIFVLINIFSSDSGDETIFDIMTAAMIMEEPPMPTHDRAGYPLTVPGDIQRIAALGAFNNEVMYELRLTDRVVSTAYDIEALLALQPDIVFATHGIHDVAPLREAGIAVAFIPEPNNPSDMMLDILFIARVTDSWTRGAGFYAEVREYFTLVNEHLMFPLINAPVPLPRPRVYIELSGAPYFQTAGNHTMLHHLLETTFAINALRHLSGAVTITDDQIFDANPDIILTFCTRRADPVSEIKARPGWENIPAVANARVYAIDGGNPETPIFNMSYVLVNIARTIFPDLF